MRGLKLNHVSKKGPRKTRIDSYYTVNNMVVDNLAMQRAKAPTTMILRLITLCRHDLHTFNNDGHLIENNNMVRIYP